MNGLIARAFAVWRPAGQRADGSWSSHHAAGLKAYAQRNYAEAERRFLAALAKAEKRGPADKRVASTLKNLGLVYKSQRKLRKAEDCFRRALRVYEQIAPSSGQAARTLYHLATLLHVQREYTEAEALYQRCIVITRRTVGENHPKLAKRLAAYARLLTHTNQDQRAAQLQARVTMIRAQHDPVAALTHSLR